MPRKAIDFASVKRQISTFQVLGLIGWRAVQVYADTMRGPCPLHGSNSQKSRVFEACDDGFHCFKCGQSGDQLRLWALLSGLDIYNAACELCGKLGLAVPWLPRRPRQPRVARNREEAR